MMTSISMLLFFACIIMGVGLLQSGERISTIETQMRELRTGYNNIASRLNEGIQPAFAAQTPPDTQVMEDSLDLSLVTNTAPLQEDTSDTASAGQIEPAEPEQTAGAPIEESLREYIVQSGDTLSDISQFFYGTTTRVRDIMYANNITNPHTLRVGTKLVIP
jgi:nucleoid-associated protein YgaU